MGFSPESYTFMTMGRQKKGYNKEPRDYRVVFLYKKRLITQAFF